MAIQERIYSPSDFKHGTCRSCGEISDEIVIDDGRCVDCIEADIFYEMTMNMDDEELSKYM